MLLIRAPRLVRYLAVTFEERPSQLSQEIMLPPTHFSVQYLDFSIENLKKRDANFKIIANKKFFLFFLRILKFFTFVMS